MRFAVITGVYLTLHLFPYFVKSCFVLTLKEDNFLFNYKDAVAVKGIKMLEKDGADFFFFFVGVVRAYK